MAMLITKDDATKKGHLTALPRASKPKKEAAEHATAADGAAEYASALHRLDVEHRKLRTAFADHLGLTHNEYDAFMHIAETGTTTPKELAATLRFTTGATTAMIDRLEKVDLVHRIPNPDDRRSVLLEPTPHGKTQAAWVVNAYTSLAATAVTTHNALTANELTETIDHITEIINTTTTHIADPAH
ncbi:MarR family winged helix-turn-helix transcriptional regulator [Subtercola boreus]|uniref:HTH marR-type domain-containing protein n=1 Tax=Subtercola boreus TaxID=120213 RepID=A0A3E0WFR7_9MICO|nr:MarR family transcriptional regulator [Subtercola boreus]RFA23340.1 hypothetical protein B7R24_00035 [Subtercola boreus]RFA23733.1 hypothetical protein B7R23_00035 [Subtercola boreus]RFA29433.1 hypothetical protein B7R25_00030 [Subtercola boreus]